MLESGMDWVGEKWRLAFSKSKGSSCKTGKLLEHTGTMVCSPQLPPARQHFPRKREVLAVSRSKHQADPGCSGTAAGEARVSTPGATPAPSKFSPAYLVPSIKGDLFHIGNDARVHEAQIALLVRLLSHQLAKLG